MKTKRIEALIHLLLDLVIPGALFTIDATISPRDTFTALIMTLLALWMIGIVLWYVIPGFFPWKDWWERL